MPGVVPGTHVLAAPKRERRGWPGRSPAMTKRESYSNASIQHRADIDRTWPDQAAAALLFTCVCRPAGGAGDREDRRKRLPRDIEGVEQDRGEELDIGVERPIRLLPPQRLADIGLDFTCER